MPFLRFAFVGLLSLCLAVSVWADEPEKVPSLSDAKMHNDVTDWMQHEFDKIDSSIDEKQRAAALAEIYMSASEKAKEIANVDWGGTQAYFLKFEALGLQVKAGIEGAEQKRDAFLDEAAAMRELRIFTEDSRFQLFTEKAVKTVNTPESFDAFKSEIKAWINRVDAVAVLTALEVAKKNGSSAEEFASELLAFVQSAECTLSVGDKKQVVKVINDRVGYYSQFDQFAKNAEETVNTPESFDAFKTGFKAWIDRGFDVSYMGQAGFHIAGKNQVSAEDFVEELVEHVRSPECPLSEVEKAQAIGALRTAIGIDPKLYGKTLDDKDFKWESLHEKDNGKYVLIKFTATWCGPCKKYIPGLLEAWEKYHDKGFEIVSIYIWEHETDPVAAVRKEVEEVKLPWMILSEDLTEKAKQPKQSDFYGIRAVPTMVLVDQEGKIILKNTFNPDEDFKTILQTKLAEIFE